MLFWKLIIFHFINFLAEKNFKEYIFQSFFLINDQKLIKIHIYILEVSKSLNLVGIKKIVKVCAYLPDLRFIFMLFQFFFFFCYVFDNYILKYLLCLFIWIFS